MINVVLFITFVMHMCALYIRKLKVKENFTIDYFALFLLASFLYNFLGQFTIIKYDDIDGPETLLFSVFILANSVVLVVAAAIFPKFDIWGSAAKNPKSLKYFVVGFVALCIGYVFWQLNYARVGGVLTSIFETFNRVDRNAMLTEQRGNLPYVHFFFIANVFLYYAFLLKTSSIKKSVAYTCLLMFPLLAFFLLEGERSSLLKHLLAFWFVTAFYKRSAPAINYRLVSVGLTVVLLFALIGNLRSHLVIWLVTGDPIRVTNQIALKGPSLVIPNEFSAVLFTAKKNYSWMNQGKLVYDYGYTFWQGIPYLFPRSVYDLVGLVKSPTVADAFGDSIANELGAVRKMGFGMSILGENIKNFGYFAIFGQLCVLLLLFVILFGISKLKSAQIVSVALIPCFFLINRMAFASVFSTIMYVFVISWIFIFSYDAVMSLRYKKNRM